MKTRLLSGKQNWRKSPHISRRRAHQTQYELHRSSCADEDSCFQSTWLATNEEEENEGENDVGLEIAPQECTEEISLQTIADDLEYKLTPPNTPEKGVSFNPLVEVCFVPTRYECAHLLRELYWRPEDYDYFKQDAVYEIRAHWRATGLSPKEAIVALYQPPSSQPPSFQPPSEASALPPAAPSLSPLSSIGKVDSLANLQQRQQSLVPGVMRHVDSLACIAHASDLTADTDSESNSSNDNQSKDFTGDLDSGEGLVI